MKIFEVCISALILIAATFFWLCLVFLLFSFVTWEINPELWGESTRFGFAIFGGLLSIVIGFVSAVSYYNIEQK